MAQGGGEGSGGLDFGGRNLDITCNFETWQMEIIYWNAMPSITYSPVLGGTCSVCEGMEQ